MNVSYRLHIHDPGDAPALEPGDYDADVRGVRRDGDQLIIAVQVRGTHRSQDNHRRRYRNKMRGKST